MGKVKSAICLTLVSLVIAVLCIVCFVPFPVGGDGIYFYNPIINWVEKSGELGGYQFDGGAGEASYLGGSFTAVFYPEGVISSSEYEKNLAALEGNERSEYEEKYVASESGSLYFEKESVCDGGTEPCEEFETHFAAQVNAMKDRYDAIHAEGLTLEVRDGYSVRVSLPSSMDACVAAFLYFSYMGDVTILYGTTQGAENCSQIIPQAGSELPISDYITGATSRSAGVNGYIVTVELTDTAKDLLSTATASAADTNGYLYVQVGGESVISLKVTESMDALMVGGTSYSADTAGIVAATIDAAVKNDFGGLRMNRGELSRTPARLSDGMMTFFIAFGVVFAAMCVFFFIRYRRLAFAHILTYLVFLLAMVLCFYSVPIVLGLGTLTAFLVASVLLCVCNAIAFEYARKEYATGKTITSSVKLGYKKCFWHIFDLHVVLAAAALLIYLIAITELKFFGLALLLGAVFSAICTLVINRFLWYITMPFAKDAGRFCHFKREEVDNDD